MVDLVGEVFVVEFEVVVYGVVFFECGGKGCVCGLVVGEKNRCMMIYWFIY